MQHFKIIDQLRRLPPKRRAKLLHATHAKNIAYFQKRYPDLPLAQMLQNIGTGRYEIRLNNHFLDIVDRFTQQIYHPPGRLEDYLQELGHWHHDAWIDKLEVVHRHIGSCEHQERIAGFLENLYRKLPPDWNTRMASGLISLPKMPKGRRFSGTTVFLGIFTGLHIIHYLNRTAVRRILLIEPDPERFALSSFFLDYAKLEQIFGGLMLHVGEDLPESPLDLLLRISPVTTATWLRLLPAYPSPVFDRIVQKVNLRWRTLHEVIVPFDREVRNLTYGAANLLAKRPLLSRRPKLSANSRIAVIGSGPSLERDLPWLKANQDRLILIAAHSAVRVLKRHGIRPDFQCTLDTELDRDWIERLELDSNIPIIAYYKADPKWLQGFQQVFLVPESEKANPVRFHDATITHTHPTSGNTAVAVAAYARPANLFLIGLDLGFRDSRRDHAKGTWHEENTASDASQRENLPIAANFSESEGKIFTHAYLNIARLHVEAALHHYADGVQIYNLSDGARILHALPRRSDELDLPPYPEKDADLQAFQAAFEPGGGNSWSRFHISGTELLENLRHDLYDALNLKRFSWPALAKALDGARDYALRKAVEREPGDIRLEAYGQLIQHLLEEWYRILLFSRTSKEAEDAHRLGLEALDRSLRELKWPAELKAFEGEPFRKQ